MATSFLLPSPASCNYRKSQVGLSLLSENWQKDITYFSFCIRRQKCKVKLYMIPYKAIARRWAFKRSASVGSLEVDAADQGHRFASGFSAPNDFVRYNMLHDSSSNPLDGMSDFERQLQEFFDELKAMIMMGNKHDAIDLLQANYEAVKEQMNAGTKGIEEIAILDVIALGYMGIGDLKFVQSLLDMMSQVVDNLKDDEPLLDAILMHMGSMYSTLENHEKSMLLYQRAINILEKRYGKNSIFLVTSLLGMAKVLGSIGRATRAIEFYHRVITIFELNRGAESVDLVLPLSGLGNQLIKEGKATDAENVFTRILKIYTRAYGENDGRVGMALCSLAHAKCAKGNTDEAIDLYKKAVKVIKDSNYMALDDSIMENIRIDLAELLHFVGRGQEGRELLEECLLITEKHKGKEHPDSVTHLLNLASSYSRSKNFVEAERILRMSLEIMTKNVGPDDQSISFPMLHLGVTLYHLNQDEEAEKFVLEAVRIREKAFGKDSLPVGEALDCLVCIQTRLGKDDAQLLELLKRVLSIQEREFGSDSEEVMLTLKKAVFYLDKLGRKDEKFPLQKRLYHLRMKYKQRVQY
ncbi:Nephrocystin-3 [Melia azedarach]|uniref:Nephrocystin-3 n=2 Tax=Melia azedarach TaxID=155640 RepID=A0ACC1YUI5_MELAZ|nr:Nephrocystin-3 [Melia azedarach]